LCQLPATAASKEARELFAVTASRAVPMASTAAFVWAPNSRSKRLIFELRDDQVRLKRFPCDQEELRNRGGQPLCALVGADVSKVAYGIGLNERIGRTYSLWGSAVAGLASR